MSLPAPMVLVIGSLFAGMAALLLCRWRRVAAAAGVALAGLLALWLRLAPLEGEVGIWRVYGRSFTLTDGSRALFSFVLAALILLFLLSLAWPQGRYFIPGGLMIYSLLAAAVMIRPFVIGVIFLFVAAAVTAVLIQSNRAGQTQAAWRYLTMAVLAVPLLLVAGWMVETGRIGLQLTAGRLFVLAFIILLAGFPFHIWLQPIVSESPPLVQALLLGLVQLVLVLIMYDLLAANPWLQAEPELMSLLGWSSGLTALTAGVLALVAVDYARLIGNLLLLDMSISLALFLAPADAGRETAVLLPILRFISLLLIGAGLSWLRRGRDGYEYAAFRGRARQVPGITAVFAFGLISLLGLPLSVGFIGRWTAVALIAGQSSVQPGVPLAILAAMGGGIYGLWRGLAPLLAAPDAVGEADHQPPFHVCLLFIGGLVSAIWLAVFPQEMVSFVHRLAASWLAAGGHG